MHLLLVEDDIDLGAELQRALGRFSFTSVWVRRVQDTHVHVSCSSPSPFACALLDLSLPDGDGLDLLHEWRQRGISLPVIVLTARDTLIARVTGLDAGADDYVIKPVAPEEVVSRVRAVVRRAGGHSASVWQVGRLQIDPRLHEVRCDGELVPLSPKEYLIVLELARDPSRVVPKHRLALALAPFDTPTELNAVEFHVHNLRRKLGAQGIVTVRGVGYRLAS